MSTKSSILLVEDDDGHAHLIQRNLKRVGVQDDFVRVSDGQEALDCLFRRDPPDSKSFPRMILLDINMPKVDGIGVLQRVKEASATRGIPVIVLTTTDNPQEIDKCYELGCSAYVTKPVEYKEFVEAISAIGAFLRIVRTAQPA